MLWLLILIPLAIFVFFAVLTFVISLRETQLPWYLAPLESADEGAMPTAPAETTSVTNPYQVSIAPSEETLPLSPKAHAVGRVLNQEGFRFLGSFRHTKGGIYKIRYDVVFSPDEYILACIESGSVMNIQVLNLSLITMHRDEDGDQNCCVSILSENCYVHSFSGKKQTMVFQGSEPLMALRLHQDRLQMLERPEVFGSDPLGEYKAFKEAEFQYAIDHGYFRPVADDSACRCTLKGALTLVPAMYGFMYGRRMFRHAWRVRRRLKALGKASYAYPESGYARRVAT